MRKLFKNNEILLKPNSWLLASITRLSIREKRELQTGTKRVGRARSHREGKKKHGKTAECEKRTSKTRRKNTRRWKKKAKARQKATDATAKRRERNKSNNLTCTVKELKEVRIQELEVKGLRRSGRGRRRSGGRSRSGRTKGRKVQNKQRWPSGIRSESTR